MNGALRWFGRMTWLGVAANLVAFIIPSIFAPDLLEAALGMGVTEFSYRWVGYAGAVLLLATLLYIPAGRDPVGLHGYAWLSVVGRGLAAFFWIWVVRRWELTGPIRLFFLMDSFFGIVFLILLQIGMPPEYKISVMNVARLITGLPAYLKNTFFGTAETDQPNPSLTWFRRIVLLSVIVHGIFAIGSLVTPVAIGAIVKTGPIKYNTVWLQNAALLLIQICLFSIPMSRDPVRYRTYAWTLVIGNALISLFWIGQDARWGFFGAERWFFVFSGGLALVLGFLLQTGLPAEYRVSVMGVARCLQSELARFKSTFQSTISRIVLAVVVLFVGYVGYELWANLIRAEPEIVYDTPEDQYKYGAIGLSISARVPFYLFEVLPEVCPDLLPVDGGGWESLGLMFEDGKDVPIGFAKRQIGYPSVEPNCALCHTGSYRVGGSGERQLTLGGPAGQLDLEALQWYLYDAVRDPRFTTSAVMEKIEEKHDLSLSQRLIYRFIILPVTVQSLNLQRQEYSWQESRPPQGRGRTDTFNPTKINAFQMPDDGTIGTVDLPAVWNQRSRVGLSLHWDGNNDNIHERNYAAAMAVGATPDSVLPPDFEEVTDYLLDLAPPKFPGEIDQEQAERGWVIFQKNCASCHAFGGQGIGTVTEIGAIATDPHRLKSFTEGMVIRFHSVYEPPFVFNSYRKTHGYANLPIDGIWARGPYLHNGSVPTLWDLLQPVDKRPKSFLKGYNVLDPKQVGFVSGGESDKTPVFELDTSVAGNSNEGHTYGTELSDDEKWDLIEYLKTL